MVDMVDKREKVNSLTEHKKNYKLINPYIMDCYAGLYPASLTKICLVLFNYLLSTRRYYKQDSQYYSEDEDRRIYTNTLIKPSDILERCNPVKYLLDNKAKEGDLGNFVRKLNEIDDQNLFYIWKYGYPHAYIFIMERDIGVWKYYNPKSCVTPKTLLKILNSASGMIGSMVDMLRKSEQEIIISDINNSFGQFINRMMNKMSSDVSSKLTKFIDNNDLMRYIKETAKILKELNPYEGLIEDDDFIKRLPPNVSEKLQKDNKEKTMTIEQMTALEKEFTPKDENITGFAVKKRTIKPKTENICTIKSDISTGEVKPEYATFESLNPFKNCNDFLTFYRKSIMSFDKDAKFFDFSVERKEANEILDLLIKNKRENDLNFLKSWVRYYATMYLKGNCIYDKNRTALKTFKASFTTYNPRYVA